MVDDQLDRDERVDLRRVAPQTGQGIAHGGQVNHARHAREVLHEDALGGEGDLMGRIPGPLSVSLGIGAPCSHRHDVIGRHVGGILVAQQVLENHLDRVGEPAHLVICCEGRRVDRKDLVVAAAHRKGGPGAEAVGVRCGGGS